MKILMLNPPFFPKFSRSSRSPAVAKGGTLYFPIWLAYATGVLEKEGHDVKLVDAPASGKTIEDVLTIARNFKPELVVCDTSTPSIYNDIKVLEKIKEEIKCFGVLVGTHVSALPVETMKLSKAIDAVAVHEYDFTLRGLARELKKKKPVLEKVDGIVFRKGNRIIKNEKRKLIENLDCIPFVSEVYARHLNIRDYFYSANLYPEVTIVTGRGCPFTCKFCYWTHVLNYGGYRMRSIDNVIEEFKFIEKRFPEAKEVFIEDDTFTAIPSRVEDFCKKKIAAGIKIRWSCNARADVSLGLLRLMRKAGCRLLCVGFESASQQILNNVRKGTRVEKIFEFMENTRRAGIMVHGCFMFGNQGETKETILETIEFAKKLNPDTAQFFPIMVYPGTATFEEFKKAGYLVTEDYSKWLDSSGQHNCMVSRPGLSNKELVELCDSARREFYLRPGYVVSKAVQAIVHPEEAVRIFKSSLVFFGQLFGKNEKKECECCA